jgi:hypothetical protein
MASPIRAIGLRQDRAGRSQTAHQDPPCSGYRRDFKSLTHCPEQLNEKFLTLAANAMSPARAKALLDRLWRLDEEPDMAAVLA